MCESKLRLKQIISLKRFNKTLHLLRRENSSNKYALEFHSRIEWLFFMETVLQIYISHKSKLIYKNNLSNKQIVRNHLHVHY